MNKFWHAYSYFARLFVMVRKFFTILFACHTSIFSPSLFSKLVIIYVAFETAVCTGGRYTITLTDLAKSCGVTE